MRIRRRPEKRELGSPERNGGKRRNAKYEKVDRVMLIEVHRFFLPSDCKFREIGFSSSPGRRRREQRACTSCNLHIYAWKLILNFRQNRMVYTSETAHVVDEIVFKFSVSDLVDGVRFLNLFRVLSEKKTSRKKCLPASERRTYTFNITPFFCDLNLKKSCSRN
ncbi:hypothetical protein QE152_g1787 [Popillia japonica]|uniref:Uncharacterized protein n=1 Tax=Popillia japonica TaxID=7064 RepID=A0AAW1N3D4_POPJA